MSNITIVGRSTNLPVANSIDAVAVSSTITYFFNYLVSAT